MPDVPTPLARPRGVRVALAVLLASSAAALVPGAAHAAAVVGPPTTNHDYVVQLKLPPLASYRGGAAGIAATSPRATGAEKLNTRSDAAQRYSRLLGSAQSRVLARTGGSAPRVLYSYRTAFSGFAATLDAGQLRAVASSPDVARVFRNELRTKQAVDPADATAVDASLGGRTGDGASYLGLPTGLWDRLGGADRAGDGIVVGIVDTGITPQHPSFADDPADGYTGSAYGAPPASWRGACDGGTDSEGAFPCNDKLIGARYFNASFKEASPLEEGSFDSARDDEGHGSHTAATAAGNYGVDPSIDGSDLGVDVISGIAPRARVAAYKALWNGTDTTGGFDADLVAAIDAAVSDGVDVINYSIGGAGAAVLTSDSFAFLGASDAGVFVAQSAGNDGPDASTLGAQAGAPWTTTVAASTLQRSFRATGTVTGSDPFTFSGESVGTALSASPLVNAPAVKAAGADDVSAQACAPDSLGAGAAGKVVICERGGKGVDGADLSRIGKSLEVQRAGGVGMVLYNPVEAQDTETDTHWVPTIHVPLSVGERLKAAAAAGARVAFTKGGATPLERGAVLAAFSSRGPQPTGAVPDIAKPDVTAPGVNILAAASPAPVASTGLRTGQLFQAISGTSMSSPHVAGAGALLSQAHPDWTPAEIKSSLMTSASPDVVQEDGTTVATPFDTGSGEVAPTAATDPGLLVDAGTADYVGYLSGQDLNVLEGDPAPPIEATDLNVPSISSAALPGSLTTTRTFTSAERGSSDWTVDVQAPAGFTGTTDTPAFTIGQGASVPVSFTFTRTDAPLGRYAYGQVVLTDGERTVRLPVSLKPSVASAPDTVDIATEAASGSEDLEVKAGTSPLGVTAWGLGLSRVEAGQQVSTGSTVNPAGDASNKAYDVTVPEGAQLLGARLEAVDGDDPATDLDLFVVKDGRVVAQSAAGGSAESVSLPLPEAGTYTIVVNGFATKGPSTFDLRHWVVSDASPNDPSDAPGIAVGGSPFTAELGADVPATLRWSGVDAPGTYFGVVTYAAGASTAPEDVGALSVVELTKTGDATDAPEEPGTPAPIPSDPGYVPENGPTTPTTPASPAPTTPGAPAAPAPPTPGAPFTIPTRTALQVDGRSISLRGRTASLRLVLSRKAAVKLTVRRGRRTVARAKARTFAAGSRTAKLVLDRRLARGTYRVTVTATVAEQVRRDVLTLRVR